MIDTEVQQHLRREMRAARAKLAPAVRMRAAMQLAQQLEILPEFQTAKNVAIYWAVNSELPLLHTVNALAMRGQRILLPVVQSNGYLKFSPWQQGIKMHVNRFGIPEPQTHESDLVNPVDLDLVLLPLLAFDRKGNRLGSGAGYYDKSFAFLQTQSRLSSKPLLIGVAYAMQAVDSLQSASWDVTLDAVVTEREWIPVNKRWANQRSDPGVNHDPAS